jgi:alkylation response protein AidB-like acyl-CoA dehydrogenase
MPGFSFGRKQNKLSLRGNVTRGLIFEDCRVPRANLLARSILMPLAREMALIAMPSFSAIAVGLAKAALEAATKYVKQRAIACGQTLTNFDGVQRTIASSGIPSAAASKRDNSHFIMRDQVPLVKSR